MIGVKINDICWSPKPSMDMNWQAPGSQHMAAQGTRMGSRLWWLRYLHPKHIYLLIIRCWLHIILTTVSKRKLGHLLLAEYTANYFDNEK